VFLTPSSRRFLIALACGLGLSARVLALDVLVVDQNNEPLANAVVSIPKGSIAQVPTEAAVMDQQNKRFVPYVLAIEKGRQVVFPNSDSIRHHVYSFSEAKTFEIKLYKGVPNQPLAFEKEGIVVLGCNIHDSMIGYIYVSPWPEFAMTSDSGRLRLEGEHNEVLVWHPRLKSGTTPIRVPLTETAEVHTLKLDVKAPVKRSFKNKFNRYYDDES